MQNILTADNKPLRPHLDVWASTQDLNQSATALNDQLRTLGNDLLRISIASALAALTVRSRRRGRIVHFLRAGPGDAAGDGRGLLRRSVRRADRPCGGVLHADARRLRIQGASERRARTLQHDHRPVAFDRAIAVLDTERGGIADQATFVPRAHSPGHRGPPRAHDLLL